MFSPEDLIQPAGPIVAAMFPDEDEDTFEDRLQAYLDEGYANVSAIATLSTADQDAGARAWALARAYNDAATIFTTKPSSASLQGLGSVGFSANAIQEWRRLGAAQQAVYDALVPTSAGVVDDIPPSAVIKTRVCW